MFVGAAGNKGPALEIAARGPTKSAVGSDLVELCRTTGQTPELKGSIELAYTIETNVWNGEYRMQLNVQDLRVVG